MKGFLTTKEAAERLGVTDSRVRQMIREGIITESFKAGRDNFIPAAEIERLANTDRPAGRPKKSDKD